MTHPFQYLFPFSVSPGSGCSGEDGSLGSDQMQQQMGSGPGRKRKKPGSTPVTSQSPQTMEDLAQVADPPVRGLKNRKNAKNKERIKRK